MKIIQSLSGGLDSATVLGYLLNEGHEVHCLNFTYGSKHNKYECEAAKNIAKYYAVPYTLIDLTNAFQGFKSNLLKSGGEIPEGHYEQSNMSLTVVPGRNTIFSAILMGYAESIDANGIALGVHQGDHEIYFDCRKEYIKALDSLIYLASNRKVEVITPFVNTDKAGIVKEGLKIGVPYELTRTCYKDQPLSCKKCGSCRERLEAFELNHAIDPISYDISDSSNIRKIELLEDVVIKKGTILKSEPITDNSIENIKYYFDPFDSKELNKYFKDIVK